MGRRKYSVEEVDFVRNNIKGKSCKEVAELGQELFGDIFDKRRVELIKSAYGITSGTFNKRLLTDEEIEFLKDNRDRHRTNELTEMVNLHFNKNYSVNYIKTFLSKNGIKAKKPKVGGMEVPIGTEMKTSERDRVFVKYRNIDLDNGIKPEDTWMVKHRYIWEQHNGKEMPNDHVVMFVDGDKFNFDPNNLVCVERKFLLFLIGKKIKFKTHEELLLLKAMFELSKAKKKVKLKLKEIKGAK